VNELVPGALERASDTAASLDTFIFKCDETTSRHEKVEPDALNIFWLRHTIDA
jgi:hypothetical protein